MKAFAYAAPRSLAEAVGIMAAEPTARPLAGGTDLIVQMRSGRKSAELVVDVKKITELSDLTFTEAEGLTIGAAVPCYRIAAHPVVCKLYRSLAELAGLIGGTQIQGRASLGGNLCNAAPSADSVPLLIALEAVAVIAGPAGLRELAVEHFCTAPGQNQMTAGELLVALRLPPPPAGSGSTYLRFIPRNEMDIAVAGVGVQVTVRDGKYTAARIALASVAPTPLYVPDAGEALKGEVAGPEAIARAAEIARAAAQPISDMRGTADYRRHLCGVLTRRALETATARAQE